MKKKEAVAFIFGNTISPVDEDNEKKKRTNLRTEVGSGDWHQEVSALTDL